MKARYFHTLTLGFISQLLCGQQAMSQAAGTIRWVVHAPAPVISSPAIGDDGTIYVGAGDYGQASVLGPGWLCSFSPQGTTNWVLSFLRPITPSPAISPSGTVYVGGWDGSLKIVRPAGDYTTIPLGGKFASSPAIGLDGTIYFGAGTSLYALHNSNSLAKSSWPMFRCDPKHTARSIQRQLHPPELLSDGTVALNFNIETGRLYAVEFSTNLTQWSELVTLSSATITNRVIDTDSPPPAHRLYRLSTRIDQ